MTHISHHIYLHISLTITPLSKSTYTQKPKAFQSITNQFKRSMEERPTRLDSLEYFISLSEVAELIEETWGIPFDSTDYYPALVRYRNEAIAFRDRFKVGLHVRVTFDSTRKLPGGKSCFFPCLILTPPDPGSALRDFTKQIDEFLQTLPQVSIASLLEESKLPECSICFTSFTVPSSPASSTNNKKENHPDSIVLPAENSQSQTVDIPVRLGCGHVSVKDCSSTNNKKETHTDSIAENSQSQTVHIPVRLPCGHVFCKDCVCLWLREFTKGYLPTCPECRSIVEGISDVPVLNENFYELIELRLN